MTPPPQWDIRGLPASWPGFPHPGSCPTCPPALLRLLEPAWAQPVLLREALTPCCATPPNCPSSPDPLLHCIRLTADDDNWAQAQCTTCLFRGPLSVTSSEVAGSGPGCATHRVQVPWVLENPSSSVSSGCVHSWEGAARPQIKTTGKHPALSPGRREDPAGHKQAWAEAISWPHPNLAPGG